MWQENWQLITNLINDWWPSVEEADGVPIAEIEQAENVLGVKLPLILRQWYLYVGKRRDLINVQENFLNTHEVYITDNGILTFCTENQNNAYWGIKVEHIGMDDPPVVLSMEDEHFREMENVGKLSVFLLNLLVWVTALTRAGYVHWLPNTPQNIETIVENFKYLGYDRGYKDSSNRYFCSEIGIIWLNDQKICFLAPTPTKLKQFEALLKSEE